MKNITVRAIKWIPVDKNHNINADAYKFISDSQYTQYQALNIAMSHMMMIYYRHNRNITSQAYKDDLKNFKYNADNILFYELGFRGKGGKGGKCKGVDTLSAVQQRIKADFSTALSHGLAKGERSINNYKRTYPLLTRGRHLKFYYDENNDIYIKWVNGIEFKVILGRKDKDYLEMMHTLNKIITGEYSLGESKIIQSGKILILKVTIDMGEIKKKEFKQENIMGIDLGINIPAYACLGNSTYVKKAFGSKDEFLKVREQFNARIKRAYSQAQLAKGGKGRKDKLSSANRFKDKERNWVKTYNHQLSKAIIEFAIKNEVSQINMEKLEKDGFDTKLLGKWSYYELQNMIEYKAQREGIEVKYVNPAYTSQTCSKCGHTHKDNRKSQEKFICTECGFKLNADHNAAINIARSTQYVSKKKTA